MSLFITKKCINCGICELECPNQAISFEKNIYKIDHNNCNECEGYYKTPACQKVCPIFNAITKINMTN